jgi:putative oxygen-independent coproporphyrinogen III oxidase
MSGFGIYVHWPFCARICPYCDFNIYRDRGQDPEPLLRAILADIAAHRAILGPRTTDSVFLGGGTPSLLSGASLSRMLAAIDAVFPLAAQAEITLEANPEHGDRFADQAAGGVNRFSLGVQAFDDAALKALGRTHSADGARAAVAAAARTGARVSVDLIFARAGQSLAAWSAELRAALALPVEHLSLYQLTIEEGTAFDRAVRRGALVPPAPDLAADLYLQTQTECAVAGFDAYEISNHARNAAARSRHNLNYWRGGEWVGVGPGAHGRVQRDGVRLATHAVRRPNTYIDRVGEAGVGWIEAETLSPRMQGEEALMMGLRLSEGVARAPIEALLGMPLSVDALAAEGWLEVHCDRIALTAQGRLVADRIVATLLA